MDESNEEQSVTLLFNSYQISKPLPKNIKNQLKINQKVKDKFLESLNILKQLLGLNTLEQIS